jgi:hypothetical protein
MANATASQIRGVCLPLLLLILFVHGTFGQDRLFADWFNMVSKTQAKQPHWITPLNSDHSSYRTEISVGHSIADSQ